MKIKEVAELTLADSVSLKNGVFTVRRGFYYTHGMTAEKYAESILSKVPGSKLVGCGEVWKPFRGGASLANRSHWWVKFTVA